MKKNFFLSFFCLLFLTCEVPLERVNPLDGLEITCVSASRVDGEHSFVVQSEISTNEEGVIDYGHCMLAVESIEDSVAFDSDYCRSREELITDEGPTSFIDTFSVSTNQDYKLFSYAKVLSVEGEEIIVESDKILKFIPAEDVPETYNCSSTGQCYEVFNGQGEFPSMEQCENECHTVEYICVSATGDCIPVSNGDGDYDSWEACWSKSDCEPDLTPESYICEEGECYDPENGLGEYDTMQECINKSDCEPARYDCNNGDCDKADDGEFENLGQCQNNCEPPTFNCNSGFGQCYQVPDGSPPGPYTSMDECDLYCDLNIWTCNPVTFNCVIPDDLDPPGIIYTSQQDCINNSDCDE